MVHQRLQNAYDAMVEWCDRNDVVFSHTVDEDDLQGYLIPRDYRSLTPRLSKFLDRIANKEGLFFIEHKTRAGTIFMVSLQAISEATIEAIIPSIDRSRLVRKLDLAFDGMVVETQYHQPSSAQRRQYTRPTQSINDKLNKKLREDLGFVSGLSAIVSEALDGIAAEYQPKEMLVRFERALRDANLLDKLKASGITNELSDDNQYIVFSVVDADNRPVPVARFELSKLGDSSEMQKAMSIVANIGHRLAPGTIETEIEKANNYKKELDKIAKTYAMDTQEQPTEAPIQRNGQATVGSGRIPVEGRTRFEELLGL